MNTPTHALIPVVIYGVMRQRVLISGTREEKKAVVRNALILAIAGAMPDALDPHITLEARLNSWSHSLLAWAGFSVLFGALCFWRWKWWTPAWAMCLSAAYLSHLIGDLVAGGIGWSYPFTGSVIGDYYIPPSLWKSADIICVLCVYLLYRLLPKCAVIRRDRKELEQKHTRAIDEQESPPTV